MDSLNADFAAFRLACEEAPVGTFEHAKEIRAMIGEAADSLLAGASRLGLTVDHCDGIHNVEATMFNMLRNKNPGGEIESALGLGRALENAPHDPMALHGSKQDIIGRLARDRDFLAGMATA